MSVNVFSTKVLIGDTIFYVSNWRRDRHFTWSSEPHEGLACRSAKGVPSFLGYFKTLSIGPAPGIEPATSRSAVTRSTHWANTAAVKKHVIYVCRVIVLLIFCHGRDGLLKAPLTVSMKPRLCSKENWREPSALKLYNLGCPAYDLHEKTKIF